MTGKPKHPGTVQQEGQSVKKWSLSQKNKTFFNTHTKKRRFGIDFAP